MTAAFLYNLKAYLLILRSHIRHPYSHPFTQLVRSGQLRCKSHSFNCVRELYVDSEVCYSADHTVKLLTDVCLHELSLLHLIHLTLQLLCLALCL